MQFNVRERLVKECERERRKNPNNSTLNSTSTTLCFRADWHPLSFVRAKQESIFCLEPEGDTPDRKSIYDSLLLGCIPVLFSDFTDDLAPWHWSADWHNASRLIISPEEYLRRPSFGTPGGKTIFDYLPEPDEDRARSAGREFREEDRVFVRKMQRVIADNAHKIM